MLSVDDNYGRMRRTAPSAALPTYGDPGRPASRNGIPHTGPEFVPYVWNIGERYRRAQVAAHLRYARERARRNMANLMQIPRGAR